jgi:flagellin-like protein
LDRGVSAVVGSVLMIAIVVGSAAVVAMFVTDVATTSNEPAPQTSFEATAEAEENVITLVHDGGDPIKMDRVRLRVEINGTPLDEQPPVPFFSASGFRPGPTGPFNPSTDNTWTAGERASIRIASTNTPVLRAGARVTVLLSVGNTVIFESTIPA